MVHQLLSSLRRIKLAAIFISVFVSSTLGLRMNMEVSGSTSSTPKWDSEKGIWVGGKAAQMEDEELPNPLWIFGYGSLCWRPEESFADFEQKRGFITGWARLFAQRSCDHRGTPEAPGLVATVVSDRDLARMGLRPPEGAGGPAGGGGGGAAPLPSITHGVAYCIPQDKARQVLDELDFREKGGYQRAVVEFTFQQENGIHMHNMESTYTTQKVPALLYTGAIDNPNFFMASTVGEAAQIISTAKGPSGPNIDYLNNLASFLREAGVHDPHVFALEEQISKMSNLKTGSSGKHENNEESSYWLKKKRRRTLKGTTAFNNREKAPEIAAYASTGTAPSSNIFYEKDGDASNPPRHEEEVPAVKLPMYVPQYPSASCSLSANSS